MKRQGTQWISECASYACNKTLERTLNSTFINPLKYWEKPTMCSTKDSPQMANMYQETHCTSQVTEEMYMETTDYSEILLHPVTML